MWNFSIQNIADGEQQVSGGNLAVVEYARAPFLVLHLERIGVFVQVRAVKLDQSAAVLREVRRNPVHDNVPDPA